jgi:AraC-like DNA-binding protein
MLSLQGMIETLVGADIANATFCFRTPEPPHGPLYRDAFRGQVRFGCPVTTIVFPGQWLERPGPYANPALFAAAIEALEAERLALENHGLAAAEVEQRLALGPGGAMAGLPEIAKDLHISVRTLERRLQEAGTSFRAIRERVLARRARALLEKTKRTIGSISEELGYSDPVAFNLACHRWFGASPRAVRLEAQEKPAAERRQGHRQ